MSSTGQQLGIYCSYDELVNGPFAEAVALSNTADYLLWLDWSAINPDRFHFPTVIVVKLKGQERYYRGELLNIQRADAVDKTALVADKTHRPPIWQSVDGQDDAGFKSALYIRRLQPIDRPACLAGRHPPQRPSYVLFETQLPTAEPDKRTSLPLCIQ